MRIGLLGSSLWMEAAEARTGEGGGLRLSEDDEEEEEPRAGKLENLLPVGCALDTDDLGRSARVGAAACGLGTRARERDGARDREEVGAAP